MKTRICPQCGKIIPSDAITCKNCGMLQFSSGKEIGGDDDELSPTGKDLPGGYGQDKNDFDLLFSKKNGTPADLFGENNDDPGPDFRLDQPLGGTADDQYDYDYDDDDEAAADREEVIRQLNKEKGFIYDDEFDEDITDFDPDEDDANRRKMLIIILSVLTVLVVVFVIVLIVMQNRNSSFEKKNDIDPTKTFTNMITFSRPDSSSEAVTPLPDSSSDTSSSETTTTTKKTVTTTRATTTPRATTTTTRATTRATTTAARTTTTTPAPTTSATTTTTTSSTSATAAPTQSSTESVAPPPSEPTQSSEPDAPVVPVPDPEEPSQPDEPELPDDSEEEPLESEEPVPEEPNDSIYGKDEAEQLMSDFAAENELGDDFEIFSEKENEEIIYAYYNEDGTVQSMYRVDLKTGDVNFYIPEDDEG